MQEYKKRTEPKKIKLAPLVDRSNVYDTLSFDNDTLPETTGNWNIKTFWKTYSTDHEDNSENNSQGISKLESL